MGLLVNVYRTGITDCTNSGISSRTDQLCLMNVDGPFEPSERALPAMLVKNHGNTVKIVPCWAGISDHGEWYPTEAHVMMGGNYAASSDSRFSKAVEDLLGHRFYGAVAIHDRVE